MAVKQHHSGLPHCLHKLRLHNGKYFDNKFLSKPRTQHSLTVVITEFELSWIVLAVRVIFLMVYPLGRMY